MPSKLSRRKFLLISGGAASLFVVGGYLFTRLNIFGKNDDNGFHVTGGKDSSPFDQGVSESVALFLTTAYGRNVPITDLQELEQRLDFAAKEDSGWRDEYNWLSVELDNIVAKLKFNDFNKLEYAKRIDVVADLFSNSPRTKRSRILALFSSHERQRLRFWKSTIPHLSRLYMHSGMPWKARGYSSWPGIAGNSSDYRTIGPEYKC